MVTIDWRGWGKGRSGGISQNPPAVRHMGDDGGWAQGAGLWGGEKHQMSGYILNTRFTTDQVWGMEKMKGGIIKILGLKSGNIRLRLNFLPGRAHSLLRAPQVEEYLLSRSKCCGSSVCRTPWKNLGHTEEV